MNKNPKSKIDMLNHNYISSILDYNPSTGSIHWKKRALSSFRSDSAGKAWNTKYALKLAGSINKHGYCLISIDYVRYLSHRLAYFIYHKSVPRFIDHIDGDRCNNKIDNLRSVTNQVNLQNSKRSSANNSGFTGVSLNKASNKWVSAIKVLGVPIYLGAFDDIESAIEARIIANIKYGFHKNHGGR